MVTAELLNAAITHSNDGILIAEYKDGDCPITFVSPAFERISGYSAKELIGKSCRCLKGNDHEQAGLDTLKKAIASGLECTVKLRNYTKDGQLFWNLLKVTYLKHEGKVTHVISINKDITQEEYSRNVLDKVNLLYREMSKRLEYTNETDQLTKLKNRGHLSTRGEFILGAAKREKLRLHAILVDVDNFKLLNAIGGESLGDKCLIKVAEIIRSYFGRATDIAIRLCDDEFVVICIEDDDQLVVARAEKLRSEVKSTQIGDFESKQHNLSVSVGIFSATPNKHTTIEDMIQRAGQLIFQGEHGIQDHIAHEKAKESSVQHSQR